LTVYEYGVDIASNLSFSDGDIQLAEYEDNIVQAVANRLNTIEGSLDLFYEDYGSVFLQFLGWRRDDTTLRFMKLELDKTLSEDPRISSFSSELEYDQQGRVQVRIRLDDFENTSVNLILDGTSVSIVEDMEVY
jgi:hypothetical protein